MNMFKYFNALLVTNPTNIRYLTGFVGAVDTEREAYVLITKSKTCLFTNSLYLEQAKNLSLKVIEVSRENPLAKELRQLLTKLNIKRLGFEEENLTVAEFQELKKELKGVTLIPTKNRVEELRMIKRPDEIANIKAAAKLTDQCFDFILPKLISGVTEGEVAWQIESFFKKYGAEIAFSPIVAFGKNSSQPHYRTRDFRLQFSDIILLDFGARVNGYCADMTRVVFVGKPKEEWKRAYQAVLEAQISVLQKLQSCYHVTVHGSRRTNLAGAQLDRLAKDIIRKAGFPPYSHSLGHNVGFAIHEQPRLSIKKDAILLPGMVFSVEPAIYKEGRYGIRLEDLVLLKKDGFEILSKSPKEMIFL